MDARIEIDEGSPESEESGPESETAARRAWIEAGKILLLSRAIFLFGAYAAGQLLTTEGMGPGFDFLWSGWDARLFFQVAEFGYTDPSTEPHATAFFPAFPLSLAALHGLGLSFTMAGLLLNVAASWVAFAFLYRWAEEELGEGAGRRAVLYLAFFPTAVFLVAPYSEALFLAGAIPAFYLARRGRWLHAALPVALATASRSAGVFLLVGLGFEFLRQKDFRLARVRDAAATLAAGLVPLIAYGAYLAAVKGSFFYYFTDQRLGWGREFVGPVESFRRTWNTYEGAGLASNWVFAWRMEIVAAAIGWFFVAWALRKKEWGYAAYMGIFLASLTTSSWYFSVPRMMLSFFPIMLLLAGYTAAAGPDAPRRHETILLTLAPLAIVGMVAYTRHAWFF